MDAAGQQDHPADRNEPGEHALAALAAIEDPFEKMGQAAQRFVNHVAVRQWPYLLDEQRAKQRKKTHAPSPPGESWRRQNAAGAREWPGTI